MPPSLTRDRRLLAHSRRRSPRTRPSRSEPRVVLVWSILMLCILALIVKLLQLQIVEASTLRKLAQEQRQIRLAPRSSRRPIVDRQGNVLAVDRIVHTLYAHPLLFKQSKQAIAQQLSPVLEKSVEDLLDLFNRQETGIKIEIEIPQELADRITKLGLNGLDLIPNQQRFYPRQDLLAHVVGYVDMDGEGQAGLEYSLQEQLLISQFASASLQHQNSISTRVGDPHIDALTNHSLAYDNLQLKLTLDSRLQRVAQRSLRRKLEEYKAQRGAVLVMDAQNGALLAMVSGTHF